MSEADKQTIRQRLEAIHAMPRTPANSHSPSPYAYSTSTPTTKMKVKVKVKPQDTTISKPTTTPRRAKRPPPKHARSPMLSSEQRSALKAEYKSKLSSELNENEEQVRKSESTTIIDTYDILLFVLCSMYILITPFTKVEESFNVQATHDILVHKWHIGRYDHHLFPGIVPRTFVGPLVISAIASPIHLLLEFFDFPKVASLILVRMVLCGIGVYSLGYFRKTLIKHLPFGKATYHAFGVLSLLQFHIPFYMSRPLPNILALAPVLVGLAWWIQGKAEKAIVILSVAMTLFRCDIAVLLAPIGLMALIKREITIKRGILVGISSVLCSILLSIAIDTIFWKRLIWPEGEVLYFNTYLNRSGEYGVSPWHWYFTSAIPRATLIAAPLAFVAVILMPKRLSRVWIPALFFVGLYSILPHKELRFIFPAFPLITVLAAVAIAGVWDKLKGKYGSFVFSVFCIGLIVFSVVLVSFFAIASVHNYPGGDAMYRIHELSDSDNGAVSSVERENDNVSVFLSVRASMTGVTHFLEKENWTYFKSDLKLPSTFYRQFSWILADSNDVIDNTTSIFTVIQEGWFEIVEYVPEFTSLKIQWKPLHFYGDGGGDDYYKLLADTVSKVLSILGVDTDTDSSSGGGNMAMFTIVFPVPVFELQPAIAILKTKT